MIRERVYGGEKEGDYCTVCGGIKPETIKIRTILVDGKATGINRTEVIIDSVRKLRLEDDAAIHIGSSRGPAPSTTYQRRREGRTVMP